MHTYLIGDSVLALIFVLLYLLRRDLRNIMLYSSLFYAAFTVACFLLLRLLTHDPAKSVTPGYWSPPTLFNIGQQTGGYAIEDLLFSLFSAGIAAALYELAFKVKITKTIDKKLHRSHALLIGVVGGSVLYVLTSVNAIYFLISLQFFGAAALVWQRRDLLVHSLAGGALFLIFYSLLFNVFNYLFPTFIGNYYNLEHTSHVFLGGIPLEEYLFGLSLGMLWAPLYEYEHRVRIKMLGRPAVNLVLPSKSH